MSFFQKDEHMRALTVLALFVGMLFTLSGFATIGKLQPLPLPNPTRMSLLSPATTVPTTEALFTGLAKLRPVKPEAPIRALKARRFALPERTPFFSDFPAYSWPNRSVLLSEVRTTSDLPGNFISDAQRSDVYFDYPCYSRKEATAEPSERVRLYIPWTKPTYMTPATFRDCPVRCELTNRAEDIPSVDGYVVDTNGALVTEKYNWTANPLRKRLVAFNTENIEGRRAVLKKGYGIRYLAKPWRDDWWAAFDVVSSYHTHSMVFTGFYHWALCREDIVAPARRALRHARSDSNEQPSVGKLSSKEPKAAPVLFFARNCDFVTHRRQGFVRQLALHIRVDAVGRCLNNKEQSSVRRCTAVKGNRRLCIIGAYPFYLSIENSISLDYVTEKLYEPLLVGTIPVYLGAPNVENFLPTNHSAILASDFTSVKQLAHYLSCVHRTRRLYEYYTSARSTSAFWLSLDSGTTRAALPSMRVDRCESKRSPCSNVRQPTVSEGDERSFSGRRQFTETLRRMPDVFHVFSLVFVD